MAVAFLRGLLAVLVASVAVGGASVAVTPVQKVIQMLDDMLATCKNGKKAEETEFAAFHEWCDQTKEAAQHRIAEATRQIAQLNADIQKAVADAEEFAAAADEAAAAADAAEAEAANATAIRKKNNADYLATHADFSESIDAIERATAVLQSRTADVAQSLLQVRDTLGASLPAEDKSAIESLLATKFGQAPQANAYEFQSTSVLDLLEKLRLKFTDERVALEKAELAAKSNYEVLMQDLTDTIKAAKETSAAKTAAKAKRVEDASIAKGELSTTETAKAEDETALDGTNVECDAKSKLYEKNQVLRADEIKAIVAATDVLRSDSVSGHAATYLPSSLAQLPPGAVSLAQLRRGREAAPEQRRRVVELLERSARKLDNRHLALIASRAAVDPFAKVKKMINDLIMRLMDEQNSEADHHAFCTTELATNKQTRENLQAEVEELAAAVEQHTAKSAQLAVEIKELNDAVAELRQQQAEATSIRKDEKATNAKTIADAKEAQVAVERAIQILKEFYAKASEASLLQGGIAQEMSRATQTPYNGMLTENGNVLGFLEVVLSDFARLETVTSSSEEESQKSYETFMNESTQNLAVKATETSHKDHAKMECDSTVASLKKELAMTQEELDAAVGYYDRLRPDCVDKNLSYAKRKESREEEIQSLKEALNILNQEDLA